MLSEKRLHPSLREHARLWMMGTVLALLVLSGTIFANPRMVVIGDVHGDYQNLVRLLQRTKVVDENLDWIGGETIFVQTGDILDRGPDDRKVLDLLMSLEKKAKKSKGQVISMIGNHEIMNVVGDLRYVSKEAYASFAEKSSEKKLQSAYDAYVKFLEKQAEKDGVIDFALPSDFQTKWFEGHPPGYVEHREAFSPSGKYGKWIRSRPALVKLENILFIHGGIHPTLTVDADKINRAIEVETKNWDVFREYLLQNKLILEHFDLSETSSTVQKEVDRLMAPFLEVSLEAAGPDAPPASKPEPDPHLKALQEFLDYPNWLIFHPIGPLWFRGFSTWTDEEALSTLPALKELFGVDHFVVGHTVQEDGRIRARLEGSIFLIDTGLLEGYYESGRPSALEIHNGKFSAIYFDGEQLLFDRAAVAPQVTP